MNAAPSASIADHQSNLLAILNNQSENIEYTKRRTNLIIAFHSAIIIAVIEHKPSGLALLSVFVALEVMAYYFGIIILDNYDKIRKRRDALNIVLKELTLSSELYTQLDSNLNNKGRTDRQLPWAAIAYLYIAPIIAILL